MVVQGDGGGAQRLEILTVVRIGLEQALGFPPRLQGLLPLQQQQGVVQARGMIVRRAFKHEGQQRQGLIGRTALLAQTRQEAQRADIAAIRGEIIADDVLGRRQIAVGLEAVGDHHLPRQLLQRGQVPGGKRRLGQIAPQAVKLFQHVPAGRQGRVEAHRLLQRGDGRRCFPSQDVAVTALLVETAETGILRLQAVEGRQGLRKAAFGAQRHSLAQQGIAPVAIDGGVHFATLGAASSNSKGSSQSGSGWSAS